MYNTEISATAHHDVISQQSIQASLIGEKKHYLNSLFFLRTIAAISVCIYHYSLTLKIVDAQSNFHYFFNHYGKFGVQIFFVISGFVIPLSLHKHQYKISSFFSFLWKRFVRLFPPLICAIFLTIILMVFSGKGQQNGFQTGTLSTIKYFFYNYLHEGNPVFWTLAAESFFYCFIGLFFIVINKYPKLSTCIFMPLLVLPAINHYPMESIMYLYPFITFFIMGIIAYMIYIKKGSLIINYTSIIALAIFCFIVFGPAQTIAAVATILIILFYKGSVAKPIIFFGRISYSFYLVHYPMGIVVVSLLLQYFTNYYLLMLITFLASAFCAWIFYILIELPSERYSKRIKYNAKGILNR